MIIALKNGRYTLLVMKVCFIGINLTEETIGDPALAIQNISQLPNTLG